MSLGRFQQPVARFSPGDGQDLVGLGPALDRAGLDAAGTVADAVPADRGQERRPEARTLLLLRPSQCALEGVPISTEKKPTIFKGACVQWARRAASRADCTAGNSRLIRVKPVCC
jgi:hypothetical protein